MYNSNFLKTTNKNANNQTVAILALCLIKYKILNRLSTLNFILKFNDNLYLNFYRTRKSLNSKITSKIFDYEKKILNFSIILSNTTRSLSYLRYLKNTNYYPI